MDTLESIPMPTILTPSEAAQHRESPPPSLKWPGAVPAVKVTVEIPGDVLHAIGRPELTKRLNAFSRRMRIISQLP